MDSYKSTPNREEYFDQLTDKVADWLEAHPQSSQSSSLKNDILGITFDKCEELMKRVEELEGALGDILGLSDTWGRQWFNDKDWAKVDNAKKLLTVNK